MTSVNALLFRTRTRRFVVKIIKIVKVQPMDNTMQHRPENQTSRANNTKPENSA